MGLTLTTNPVGASASKFFAGFQKCELVFKREDLAVINVEAGTGGAKINHAGDLTSVLSEGDTIYLYSEGTNYTYDGIFEILTIVAGEITVDTPYIESSTLGYINYRKNYFVELQCVNPTLPEVNLLPFNLQSDGDAKGNITIDVSIVNELNVQRGAMAEKYISESVKQFEVRYREVYEGSSNSYTLVDGKLFILLYAIEEPLEDTILNHFDTPQLYLGYPGAIVALKKALSAGSTVEMTYNELDINKEIITNGTLGSLAATVNGFLSWLWEANTSVNEGTKYIDFTLGETGVFDFRSPDFAFPDFKTQ